MPGTQGSVESEDEGCLTHQSFARDDKRSGVILSEAASS